MASKTLNIVFASLLISQAISFYLIFELKQIIGEYPSPYECSNKIGEEFNFCTMLHPDRTVSGDIQGIFERLEDVEEEFGNKNNHIINKALLPDKLSGEDSSETILKIATQVDRNATEVHRNRCLIKASQGLPLDDCY